jgi:hypothetical protein
VQVINELVPHVPETKYGADTWEWTVNRDRYEKMAAFGAEVLFEGIERSDQSFIVLASSVLEIVWEGDGNAHVGSGTIKNLGLAYVKLVQSTTDATKAELEGNAMLAQATNYRAVASVRAYEAWSRFLKMKGAKSDSGYLNIKRVVKALKDAAAAKKE